MGTQYSSDIQTRRTSEGIQFRFLFFLPKHYTELTMNMFVIAAACLVAAVSAEADPWYGYGYGGYLHQQAWPGARGPGFEGTSYVARSPQGLRGKRSAEPYYGYGFYGYPYGLRAYGPGIAGHPSGTSYVHRSPQGLGK